jgi:CBS domain-containing protein
MNNRFEIIKSTIPFNVLPNDVQTGVAELLKEVKYDTEAIIYHQDTTKMHGVDIIVKGEYESFFYDNAQTKRYIEIHAKGSFYGAISILVNRKRSLKTVIAKKGTVVYTLPKKDFIELCKSFENFFHYFTAEYGHYLLDDEFAGFIKRPATFNESYIAIDELYSRKIESIQYRNIVACAGSAPIYMAAVMMAKNKVSCLFVKDETEKIIGYVTDITIRDKVVATVSDAKGPLISIMDKPVVSINIQAYVYEAILMMFRTKTRYLLIEENGEYIGFQSRNKLLSEQAQSPLVFIQSVKSASTVWELTKKWRKVPEIVAQLLERGVNAEIANQVITTVADTIAIKVIEDVIDEMGQPPAKFVFMVLGSEGRKEQTLKTDQDNAIIYEDKANEHRELVREYFLKLADIVSGRLNDIGFSFCEGGFMAKNHEWTHSLSYWKRNYAGWIETPLAETAIKFSTFFDCRFLYGEAEIMDELKNFLDEELQKPLEKLFYFMAKNALQYEPPLTFFKNIRTTTIGSQEVFDIKKAMTPIVDLVRVYALQNRIFEVNTGERLKALKEKGIFTETSFNELIQSYYFLMSMRLKNQANQIINDRKEPDNYIDLNKLTKIEQGTLVEIFKTIANFQSRIRIYFTNNLFG